MYQKIDIHVMKLIFDAYSIEWNVVTEYLLLFLIERQTWHSHHL